MAAARAHVSQGWSSAPNTAQTANLSAQGRRHSRQAALPRAAARETPVHLAQQVLQRVHFGRRLRQHAQATRDGMNATHQHDDYSFQEQPLPIHARTASPLRARGRCEWNTVHLFDQHDKEFVWQYHEVASGLDGVATSMLRLQIYGQASISRLRVAARFGHILVGRGFVTIGRAGVGVARPGWLAQWRCFGYHVAFYGMWNASQPFSKTITHHAKH
jgi:hypothetical protein